MIPVNPETPTEFEIKVIKKADGTGRILLTIGHQQGATIVGIDSVIARKIADALDKCIIEVETGLSLIGGKRLQIAR